MEKTGLLAGKTILIMGVANEKSLAWGMAQAAVAHGVGKLIFTYPNAAIEKRLRPLAALLNQAGTTVDVLECDVASDESLEKLAAALAGEQIDGVVHAIAFADKSELTGGLTGTSRENFRVAMDVSCYSLIAVMKAVKPLLAPGASVVTLSYLGSQKVVANYNVMGLAKAALEAAVRYLAAEFSPPAASGTAPGVRVNAISAGPVNTLAARGIGDFPAMLRHHQNVAPLRRLTTPEDVGGAGVYLLSGLSAGVTGEIHYVDGGASILGPTPPIEE